jgi:hypothetical protein
MPKRESIYLYNMRDNEQLNQALNLHRDVMQEASVRFEPIAKLMEDFSKDLKDRLGENWEKIEQVMKEINMLPPYFNKLDWHLRMNHESGALYMETRTSDPEKLKRLLESLS